jgi:hypothetical protein
MLHTLEFARVGERLARPPAFRHSDLARYTSEAP